MIVTASSVIKELGISAELLHRATKAKIVPIVKEEGRVHPKFDSDFIKLNREDILKRVCEMKNKQKKTQKKVANNLAKEIAEMKAELKVQSNLLTELRFELTNRKH